jgi:hypothetical protein
MKLSWSICGSSVGDLVGTARQNDYIESSYFYYFACQFLTDDHVERPVVDRVERPVDDHIELTY